MKTLKFLPLIVLLVAAFSMTSCNKDDDSGTSENSFTFDGTTYTFARGYIEDFGSNGNGSFDWDVFLVSDGITLNSGFLTGVGDLVYIDLNTSSETGLVSGTYTFNTQRDAFTFVDGTIGIGFDLSTQSGTTAEITGGTVDIDANGNNVTIDFNLDTVSGSLSGNFSGNLLPI